MKAIVFFEGKEVCQVECDRHVQFGGQVTFYLNDEIVGDFCEGYCFVIDHTVLKSIINGDMLTVPAIGGSSLISFPFWGGKTF